MRKKSGGALFSLILVLFLDGMGQGIVFPVYTKALFDTHSTLLAATTPEAMRHIWYGILVGIFFLCWFLGAAILSDLSDKSGRKNALILCLGGSAIGNFLSAWAFTLNNVWLLLLGRIIIGLTNGNQPIAQASIVDTSEKDKLSRNLGFVIMAVSLGLIAGPLIGGFLSNKRFVSWFSDSTPLYFAALMALVNILLLLIFYRETFAVHQKVKIHLSKAFQIFLSAFQNKSVRFLTICYFFLQTGWMIYYVYISAFMVLEYALSRDDVSIFFSLLSFGLTVGLALLSAFFEKRKIGRREVVIGGYGLFLLSLIITAFTDRQIWAWIAAFFVGAGIGTGYPFILTLFSKQVSKDKQGWVMGITSAFVALAAAVASLIEGVLSLLDLRLPFYFAIGLLTFGLLIFLRFKSTESDRSL